MSTIKADTVQNTSGGAATLTKQTAAKGFIAFFSSGTPSINNSFNVSSLTDNGTGNWQNNWTSSMSGQNDYTIDGAIRIDNGNTAVGGGSLNIYRLTTAMGTTNCRYTTTNLADAVDDFNEVVNHSCGDLA